MLSQKLRQKVLYNFPSRKGTSEHENSQDGALLPAWWQMTWSYYSLLYLSYALSELLLFAWSIYRLCQHVETPHTPGLLTHVIMIISLLAVVLDNSREFLYVLCLTLKGSS